jgi:hypothetical protein
MPGRTADGNERASGILPEVVEQSGHERNGIGKFIVEKAPHVVVDDGCGEAARAVELPKKGAGKGAVWVRQRNHHETLARPDVKGVFLHLPGTVGRRRDRKLLITVGQIALAVFETVETLHGARTEEKAPSTPMIASARASTGWSVSMSTNWAAGAARSTSEQWWLNLTRTFGYR